MKTFHDVACEVDRRAGLTFPFNEHVVGLMEVGSGAHGTKLDPSNEHFIDDTDILGVIIPPMTHILGLHRWDCWVSPGDDKTDMDITLMEWGKFVKLLLKSNPNVLGTLWMDQPGYIFTEAPFRMLRYWRDAFASQQVYYSFTGYAHAQVKKMVNQTYNGYMGQKRKSLVDRYGYDCKNAAHAIRLFRMGIEFLKTGQFIIDRTGIDADELREIKSGAYSLSKVEGLVRSLAYDAELAKVETKLPEFPDLVRAEKLLLEGYEEFLSKEFR